MRLGLPRCERRTTPNRIVAASAAGLLAACPVFFLVYSVLDQTLPSLPSDPGEIAGLIAGLIAGVLIAFPIMVGLAGLPAFLAWILLHAWRLHFAAAALAVGALTGAGWSLALPSLYLPTAIALTAAGAVSGLVTWRVAYGPFFAAPRSLGSPSEVQAG